MVYSVRGDLSPPVAHILPVAHPYTGFGRLQYLVAGFEGRVAQQRVVARILLLTQVTFAMHRHRHIGNENKTRSFTGMATGDTVMSRNNSCPA